MTQTDEQIDISSIIETPDLSEVSTLTSASTDRRTFTQAVRAMFILESDLRALIAASEPIPDIALEYVSATYADLRSKVLDLLGGAARERAEDRLLGLPPVSGDTDAASLLLRMSQATRFIATEESWPQIRQALDGAPGARPSGIEGAVAAAGSADLAGYI